MLITQRVDNFSLSDAAVALQSVVLVAVENDAAQVQALLQEALGKVSDVLPEPAAQVFFSRFSADGLEMTLNFWVANQLHTRTAVLSRVNTAVWSALSKAGIKLPPSKAIANLSTSTGDESR